MTVEQIAFEVGRNPKTVRAFLRDRYRRGDGTRWGRKGTRWDLDSEMVAAVRRRWPAPPSTRGPLSGVYAALTKIEQACEELREELGREDGVARLVA